MSRLALNGSTSSNRIIVTVSIYIAITNRIITVDLICIICIIVFIYALTLTGKNSHS